MIMTDGPDGLRIGSYVTDGDIDELTRQTRANRKLRTTLNNIKGKQLHEEDLRELHPGLMEIWEQYQVLLKLADK